LKEKKTDIKNITTQKKTSPSIEEEEEEKSMSQTSTPRSSMTFMGQVATSRHKMVQQVIKNVVTDLTFIDKPSSEYKQCYETLQQYIMDPKTTDIVYVQLLQRSKDNKNRVVVLLKCMDLIKTFIKMYTPNLSVLIQIHQFCHVMLSIEHKLPHSGLNKVLLLLYLYCVTLYLIMYHDRVLLLFVVKWWI
jgi:hypothetical protein